MAPCRARVGAINGGCGTSISGDFVARLGRRTAQGNEGREAVQASTWAPDRPPRTGRLRRAVAPAATSGRAPSGTPSASATSLHTALFALPPSGGARHAHPHFQLRRTSRPPAVRRGWHTPEDLVAPRAGRDVNGYEGFFGHARSSQSGPGLRRPRRRPVPAAVGRRNQPSRFPRTRRQSSASPKPERSFSTRRGRGGGGGGGHGARGLRRGVGRRRRPTLMGAWAGEVITRPVEPAAGVAATRRRGALGRAWARAYAEDREVAADLGQLARGVG